MKQMAFLVVAFLAAAAYAQDKPAAAMDKPAAATDKPAAAKEAEAVKPEPVKEEAAKPAAPPTKSAASRKGQRRWNEDARHCLERASNTEVIKCAEEYL